MKLQELRIMPDRLLVLVQLIVVEYPQIVVHPRVQGVDLYALQVFALGVFVHAVFVVYNGEVIMHVEPLSFNRIFHILYFPPV